MITIDNSTTFEVRLGDNLDFMRGQPDKSFDLVIADPWYGIGMTRNDTTGFAKRRFRQIEGKGTQAGFTDEAPPREFFDQVRRIGKKVWIWGGNYFLDVLGTCRGPYIWDKGTGANYFADGEMAWNNVLSCMRIFHHQWCGSIRASEVGEKLFHPCQKPVAVYKDIILRSKLKPGARIYDPTCGSGSSGVAALELGFTYVASEIVPLYRDRAFERLDNASRQTELFSAHEIFPDLFVGEPVAQGVAQ